MAKSLIIAVAKAKLFPKLQLQANLKTKLYLKTGLDLKLQIGGWWVTYSGKLCVFTKIFFLSPQRPTDFVNNRAILYNKKKTLNGHNF